MLEMDFSRLKGRMREKGVTQEELAKAIGISAASLNKKLNNKTDFCLRETFAIGKILSIEDATEYFFTPKA